VGDPAILNKDRLPIRYELPTDTEIINPFSDRFGLFDNIEEELIDVFDNNLTFAVYNLMKWKGKPLTLAPFQSVVLQTLWDKTFPILLCTRGAGKSYLLAVYSLLKAILVQGSRIVIVAASFRQSKIVFDYIIKIHDESPIIQEATTKILRQNDHWEMAIGSSTIKALPLGNGDKIRGVRASDILCDEFSSIPEEIFQVVVRGFAAVSSDPVDAANLLAIENEKIKKGLMKEEDRKRKVGNKIIYTGTANFRFNHFWKLYCIHKKIIDSKFIGDGSKLNESFMQDKETQAASFEGQIDYRDYAIIQLPYTALPEGFMDVKQISQARATMPKALFSMEYECMFPNDSDGFFKRSLINEATPGYNGSDGAFGVELSGSSEFEYVMGVDPARRTDNFAISILKILKDGTYKNVYCSSMNNKNWVEAVRRIRDLLRKFKIVRIAVDSAGGGTTVEDLLQDRELAQPGDRLIWRYDEPDHIRYDGDHILSMVNFTPSWIAEANYGLAADIEHKRLLFPFRTTSVNTDESAEPVWDEMDEQLNELCIITVTSTKTGVQHFDLPDTGIESTISTVARKDRYSALLLAAWAARNYVSEGKKTVMPEIGDWIEYI
jgi:hypothetical protein